MNNKAFIVSFTDMGLRILIASCLVALVCGKSLGKRYFVAFLRISIFVTVLKGIRNMRILFTVILCHNVIVFVSKYSNHFSEKEDPSYLWKGTKNRFVYDKKKLNVLPVDTTFKMKTFSYTMLTSCPFAMTNYPKAN